MYTIVTVGAFFEAVLEERLSEGEARVFCELFQGQTAAQTADTLGVSEHTVRTHRRNVYRRIGHKKLLELVNAYHDFFSSSQPEN